MRLDAASGLVAAALIVAGFALSAAAPPPAEPAAELARHLSGSRDRILAGDLLVAAGAAFYIWFLAALQTHLRTLPHRELTLSATAFAGGAAAMTVVVAGVALQAGLVLDESTLRSDVAVRLGFDGYNALITIAGFGFALTAAAAAGSARRSGALGGMLIWAGFATAALQLATIPGLVMTSGPFAPAAPIPVIAFWTLALWSSAVSVTLIRPRRPALD
jgi:hypothetical protein